MNNLAVNNQDWRYEIKFIVNKEEEGYLFSWISKNKTIYRAYPSRSVNTMYFDDLSNSSMVDNLSGISSRLKYRLRWYNDNSKGIKTQFEMKIKNGRLSKKIVTNLDYYVSNPLDINEKKLYELLKNSDLKKNILYDLPVLNSIIMIKYTREYFEGINGLRITIDSDLNFFSLQNKQTDFLDNEFDYPTILELKFPPSKKEYVSYLIKDLPFTAKRNSKYLLGASKIGLASYL